LRKNAVKARLLAGESVINGWLAIPSSFSAEVVGMTGFDAVTVDLQHGMIGFDAALGMLQALSATSAIPLARVPVNDGAQIMRLLDAGAYGIICPMISTAEDAARFVSACRYPPLGDRSFGPARGLLYGGADYFQHANAEMLTIGMIETRSALDHLEAILATEGLDGIYIGPNDLSLALGHAPSSEPTAPEVVQAIAHICERTLAHNKIPGIFCSSGQAAAMRLAQGFRMVTPGNEANLLKQACVAALAAARQAAAPAASQGSGY
jgi:4-hydroxy-2-oxoheptanedioate aldolase